MRFRILVLLMLLGVATAAPAQISIGINFSLFPELVRVPNYPVYYAPRQNANYFFYDGMYWVYQNDDWYSSEWYNGPWWRTGPEYVPEYVLRIPVRYYRSPPAYFRGWGRDAPPRWGEHWGRDWEQRRSGWDNWDRRSAPAPAPLPTYQRQYSGNKYPKMEQQQTLHDQKYRYQPKDALVREHVQPPMRAASAPAARERQAEPQRKDAGKDVRDQKSQSQAAPPREQQQKSQPQAAPQREQQQKSQPQAAPQREQQQKSQPQAAPQREQQPRPQPQAAPQREQQQKSQPQAAPQREQQPRPQPQAAPQREQQQKSQPQAAPQREQGGEQRQGQDKGQERSRGKGEDNK